MQTIVMIGQLLAGLSILVFIHELGHFLTARLFKIRVEKFFIFFDFGGKKLFSFKRGDTEYGIGWFPLGGYVKISGMIDESMDKEQLAKPPEPWEFRSKPTWQRLIVMVAGVFMNLILGIFIFSIMAMHYGETYIPVKGNDPGIVALKLGRELGLKTGDTILKINDKNYTDLKQFRDIFSYDLLLSDNAKLTIRREGGLKEVKMPKDLINKLSEQGIDNFVIPGDRFYVNKVMSGTNAFKGGLKPSDKIIKINDTSIYYFPQIIIVLADHKNQDVKLTVVRKGDTVVLNKVLVDKDGKLGFEAHRDITFVTDKYGFFKSFAVGNHNAWRLLKENTKGFMKLFGGHVDPRKAIQGPISIAKNIYGGEWIWERFWRMTGLLSLILAFMNLLPIPALDGGHVITIFIEIITGRPMKQKVLEVIQTIGLVIVFALIGFSIFNDIIQNFFK